MKIAALTTFPEIYDSYMNASMMKIAQDKKILDFHAYNLRDWTSDPHKTTDDKPYGGGPGQLMMCEPIFKAYDDIKTDDTYTIFLSPVGETFNDKIAVDLAQKKELLFICGHYEGIDERAYSLADKIISIGDYVITSGELSSMVVIDSVVRKLPGVLSSEDAVADESFSNGLLEAPQYTRPQNFRGMEVPDVLTSGDHAKIKEWKHEQSLIRTKKYRPDLLDLS
ncbi:MAG: tRNA (guanosine(37)-N1)-methyltransferase TrmD [Coriobacteriia bacterium]|nr:tRNA (guanosine(37)-N1)-methyltransferase TrmD [Coriobacteriia bacterium]